MNSPATPTLTITRAGLVGTLIMLAIAALCIRLGIWQLARLEQRKTRNEQYAQRFQADPIELTASIGDTAGLLGRRAGATGSYDHERSIVLSGRSFRGVPGVHVLTPLMLGGGPNAVLVNRGWVPSADGTTILLDSLTHPPTARLQGLILPFPSGAAPAPAGRPVAASDTFRIVWFTVDSERLHRQFPYRLLNLQLQALPSAGDPPRFPAPLPLPTLDQGPHLGYAIQWFSFAAIAIIGWFAIMIKKGEVRRG